MKIPYNNLPETFKNSFEETEWGHDALFRIYERHGFDETSFHEWRNTSAYGESETINNAIASAWDYLEEEEQRNMIQMWMEKMMKTFGDCIEFMEKHS